MSGREWKPGDVAMVSCTQDESCTTAEHPAIFSKSHSWFLLDLGEYSSEVEPFRPLVVIDPEDREQVERLASDFLAHAVAQRPTVSAVADTLQAALREFANPTPDEPGKYGSVVAGDGREWLRYTTSERSGFDWVRPDLSGGTEYARWDDLDVVRILSPGVTS